MMAPSSMVGMEQPDEAGARNHQRASRRSSKTGEMKAPLMSQKELWASCQAHFWQWYENISYICSFVFDWLFGIWYEYDVCSQTSPLSKPFHLRANVLKLLSLRLYAFNPSESTNVNRIKFRECSKCIEVGQLCLANRWMAVPMFTWPGQAGKIKRFHSSAPLRCHKLQQVQEPQRFKCFKRTIA